MGALDILSNIGSAIGIGSDDNKPPKMVKSTAFDGSETTMPEGALSLSGSNAKAPSGLADFIPMAGPKGSKTFIDPKSSEALLKNMQDFVDQRSNPQAQWMNNLANAQAWTIGNPAEAAQAIKGRQELATTQAKDVQDMQMQIAQFRAAQERNKAYNDMLKNTYGTQAQTGGAPQAGNDPQAGGAPQTVTTASGQRFAFSSLPPEIQAAARSQPTPEEFQKVITDWAAEHAKGAQKIAGEIDVQGRDYVTVKGPNGTEYPSLKKDVPALLAKLYPNGVTSDSVTTTAPSVTTTAPSVAPMAPSVATTATPQGRHKGVAADVNNPGGMLDANGFFVYNTPAEGVQAMQDLTGRYLAGEGPMKGIKPTVENMTGVWATGNANNQPPNYAPFVKQELSKAGIQLNPDSTVPNTPEANRALTAARIKFESGKNAGKFLPFVGQTAPAQTSPTQVDAAPTDKPKLNDQIQQLINSIPKPSPQANAAQWDKYNSTINDLRSKLSSAPIESAQAANKTTEVARATNSAINEKAAVENANLYNTTYKSALDKLESFANNKKNDPLFAIGDRQNDMVSKMYNAAVHLGVDPTAARNTAILNDPRITDSQRAGMNEYDALQNQIVSAYVHQTFPGRILASELTLGAKSKGIGLDTQRESNARSLASIRNVFEITDKLTRGFDEYRKSPGHENALYDDYVNSKEASNIIKSSNEAVMRKFPGAYSKAEAPAEDKFAKHKKAQ